MKPPTEDLRWMTHQKRNELADEYKRDFLGLIEKTGMVEEHSYRSSFPFARGSDILTWNRLVPFQKIRGRLVPYDEIQEGSRYFVSHRWLHPTHPDPRGRHLELLRSHVSADSYYWIDFCCLPQRPRSVEEETLFRESLRRLPSLMFKLPFIVLRSEKDGYLERAWCFFELLAANVLGARTDRISEHASGTDTDQMERKILEETLLQKQLPRGLGVTETDDLEAIHDATRTVATFAELRLVEHYLGLGQEISDQRLFFGEDPYYFVATCDFSEVMAWAFTKGREVGMRLIDLSRDPYESNFFVEMAERERIAHAVDPARLPPKVTLDQSRLGWLIANRSRPDSASNLFYLLTGMIR